MILAHVRGIAGEPRDPESNESNQLLVPRDRTRQDRAKNIARTSDEIGQAQRTVK